MTLDRRQHFAAASHREGQSSGGNPFCKLCGGWNTCHSWCPLKQGNG